MNSVSKWMHSIRRMKRIDRNKSLNFYINKLVVLFILVIFVIGCTKKGVKHESHNSKTSEILYIEGLNGLDELNINDFIYLNKIGLLDASYSKKYKRILRSMNSIVSKRAKAEIIMQTDDIIEIVIYNRQNQSLPWLNVKYYFKDKILTKGPIFDEFKLKN